MKKSILNYMKSICLYGAIMILFLATTKKAVFANDYIYSTISDTVRSGSLLLKPLLVGSGMPDDFWTKKHLFYINGKKVFKNLEEYRGKLILVDFWATWCGQCWEQIPKNEKLVASYGGEVAILLVDPKSTQDTFEKIAGSHKKYVGGDSARLLETIYEDEYFSSLFPVRGYPVYMWITPAGKFVAGTTRHSVTKGHIDGLL